MNDIAVFIFGASVFVTYVVGLLYMVNEQHKIQAGQRTEELPNADVHEVKTRA